MKGEQDFVVVFPEQESIELLTRYLSTAPFDTDSVDTWSVPIFVGADSIPSDVLKPNNRYNAFASKMDYWYDVETGQLNLVIPLISQTLTYRHGEIQLDTGVASMYNVSYVPTLTIRFGFPSLSPSYRAFVNSMNRSIEGLRGKERLVFSGEQLLDSGGVVPNMEGMKWYARHHDVPIF